jgi:adenylate cyclase
MGARLAGMSSRHARRASGGYPRGRARGHPHAMILAATLDRINRWPETLEREAAKLWRRYGQTVAVVVVDLAGYSRDTDERGVVAALCRVRGMERLGEAIAEKRGGRLVKTDADNLFLTFGTIEAGDLAAHELASFGLCVGLGYGPCLVFKAELAGSEVNLASKLGEDLAQPGEVLATHAATLALSTALAAEGD